MSLAAGARIGPYEVLAPLGAGGMGEVYRARDPRLNRDVAVKILPPSGDRARFQSEARALAALNHPNILAIFDVGDDYLVTELIDGSPWKSGGLRQTIDLAAQVCDGLAAAHSIGIAHRDLKPLNILVTREGRAKILDFGIAKRTGPGADETHTMEGVVVGTAGYMSPEQIRGQEVDARSDLFSLGVILYEQLAAQRPFQGDTVAQTMTAILEKEPRELPDEVPAALRQVVYRCLAKDREQRFQNASDLAFALRAMGTSSTGTGQATVKARSRSWLWPAVAAVLALALAGVSAWHLSEKPEPVRVLQLPLGAPEGTSFASLGREGPAVISPDGATVLIPAMDRADGAGHLWLRPLDKMEARKLEGTRGATYPFWSPDSKHIAFFADGKLKRIAAAGGPALPVCDAEGGRGGDWSEQDIILFAPSNHSPLFQVAANGGTPKPVTKLPPEYRNHRLPVFLPGGRNFLFSGLTGPTGGANHPVFASSLDGGTPREVLRSDSRVSYVPPAGGEKLGWLLFVRNNVLLAQRFDAVKMQLDGNPMALVSGVITTPGRQTADFSVSANGVMVYRTGQAGTARICWLDRSGQETEILPSQPVAAGLYNAPRLSPSGKQVAFTLKVGGNDDLWILDVDRSAPTRFTFEPSLNRSPAWSPDGLWLAYSSTQGTFLRPANGTGQPQVLVNPPGYNPNDWSPDGRFLLLGAQPRASLDIHVLPIGTDRKPGEPYPLLETRFFEVGARLSPDGKWIAYVSDEGGTGTAEVYVRPVTFEGGRLVIGAGKWGVSTGGGRSPMWRKDGRELFFQRVNSMMSVAVKPGPGFAFDPPKVLFEKSLLGYDVAPGGNRFVAMIPERDPAQEPLTVVVNWPAAMGK